MKSMSEILKIYRLSSLFILFSFFTVSNEARSENTNQNKSLLEYSDNIFVREDTINNLIKSIKNIEQFSCDYPQEKVFLQFDNSAYYVGETIWFKAFVALSMGNRPTVVSKVLYVELLDQYGDVVDKRKLKIENGMCHGEFSIKEDMRSGYYEVRAYTRVMLNWGDDIIFSRVFPIFKQNKVYGDYSKQTIVPVPKNR